MKNKLSGGVKGKSKKQEKPKKNIKKPTKKGNKPEKDDLDDLKQKLIDGELPEYEEDVLDLGEPLEKEYVKRKKIDDEFAKQFNEIDDPHFTPITDGDERGVPQEYGVMLSEKQDLIRDAYLKEEK